MSLLVSWKIDSVLKVQDKWQLSLEHFDINCLEFAYDIKPNCKIKKVWKIVLFGAHRNSKGLSHATRRAVTSAGCLIDNHGIKGILDLNRFFFRNE
jgi:hypothetical protein